MHISLITAKPEIKRCADIWLEASLAGHSFVASEFWHSNLAAMRERYLPTATIYAAKDGASVLGFAAVREESLEALFVSPGWWGKGVGGSILKHVQTKYSELRLSVYVKNFRAIGFYRKYGFCVLHEQTCPHTGEPEFVMRWERSEGLPPGAVTRLKPADEPDAGSVQAGQTVQTGPETLPD